MKLPQSIRPEPYTKSTKPVHFLPPSFRTTAPHQYRVLGAEGQKLQQAPSEVPLTTPGITIQASDRDYVTTPEGSIRRADGGRRRPHKPEARQQAKARERIEAGLQKRDRRRVERLERHLAKGLGRARKIVETVDQLTGKKYTAIVIDDPAAEVLR